MLAGLRVYRSGPDGIPLSSHSYLIGTGPHQQPLMPNPVPIEFVDVAHKISRRLAIEQYRRARISFKFNFRKGSGNLVTGCLEDDI